MSEGGEATPHISAAREHLAAFLTEIRQARLNHEADPVPLNQYAHVGRGLDYSLEALEVR